MLKKTGITLILLLLLGCTNVSKNNNYITENEKILIEQINSWNLKDAKVTFIEMKPILTPTKLHEYKTLISEKDREKAELNELIEKLKVAFSKNQIFIIERYTKRGFKNKMKLKDLEKVDLSGGNIYTGDPKFNGNQAKVLTLFNYYDESLYLDIIFGLEDGQWKIVDFNERG
jgi:hypothetical protein